MGIKQGENDMTSKRNIVIGATLVALLAVLFTGQSLLTKASAQASSGVMAPKFEVDPSWPKPLPNGYQLGQTIGVAVDAQDHVWIVHRANPDDVEAAKEKGTGLCCTTGDPTAPDGVITANVRHDPRLVCSELYSCEADTTWPMCGRRSVSNLTVFRRYTTGASGKRKSNELSSSCSRGTLLDSRNKHRCSKVL